MTVDLLSTLEITAADDPDKQKEVVKKFVIDEFAHIQQIDSQD